MYFCHLASEIVLSTESITEEEGQPSTLTCQSNETSGMYSFFYIDAHRNIINYGNGEGSNSTNQAFIECEFGSF